MRLPRRARSGEASPSWTTTASGRSRSSGASWSPGATIALPWNDLDDVAAVYFTGGDPAALREARRAGILVATARELPTLKEAGVQLDALVQSGSDAGEQYRPGELQPSPRVVVDDRRPPRRPLCRGRQAGHVGGGRASGPVVDAYGAGDSFAAGLTFALGEATSDRRGARLRGALRGRGDDPPRRLLSDDLGDRRGHRQAAASLPCFVAEHNHSEGLRSGE